MVQKPKQAPLTPHILRYFNEERCAMIADALAILDPDTIQGHDMCDHLERIMRCYAENGGADIKGMRQN